MFRILGNIDAFKEKMGVNLTHYDVNWVYNHHKLTGQGYYLKTRVPAVRLISGEWHDGIHCPTREGTPGGMLGLGLSF